jgi:CheY-like chemotaxis protein
MDLIIPGLWDISTAAARGDAVFFVGAGLSAGAGAPAWDQLAAGLAAELTPRTRERSPQMIAQFFRNQHGDHRLYTYLREALNRRVLKPTEAHTRLCALPVNVFVTTNYDCLLEDALKECQRPVHAITDDNDLALWNERAEVQVIKIHGDLDRTRSIVLTEEDYVRFLHANVGMRRKLLDFFCYRTVIFLGYSMRDIDVNLLYNQIVHELGGLKRPAYLLTFDVPDTHSQREWERRGIIPITIPQRGKQSKNEALIELLGEIERQTKSLLSPTRCDLLIVEDHIDSLQALRTLMEGFFTLRIESATDGLEASLAIGKLRPRVVFVDLMLPRMDGLDLIRLIRKDPDLNDTKIVVLSAMQDVVEEGFGDGFMKKHRVDLAVAKPIDVRTFLKQVEVFLV